MKDENVRVATWNCQTDIAKHWDALAHLHVDVIAVQECGAGTRAQAEKHGWGCDWRPGGWDKDIAVLARKPYGIESSECPEPFFISAFISGPHRFRFVCFWAMTPSFAGAEYPRQATRMIEHLPRDGVATVVAGDFNASQSAEYLANVTRLRRMGMVSAYHAFHGAEHLDVARHPADFEPTSYHHWDRGRPFHMDFVFVPETWTINAVEVGTFEDYTGAGLSDHVPLVVTVDPSTS